MIPNNPICDACEMETDQVLEPLCYDCEFEQSIPSELLSFMSWAPPLLTSEEESFAEQLAREIED
jgi:hypothetical protein